MSLYLSVSDLYFYVEVFFMALTKIIGFCITDRLKEIYL